MPAIEIVGIAGAFLFAGIVFFAIRSTFRWSEQQNGSVKKVAPR